VLLLEISNRDPGDSVYYTDPDVDLKVENGAMTRRDGTPY
jgi:hypothetical protein